ncbi:MAG: glycosyltransferase family 4 protein [Bacillota bacterium]
MQILVICQYYYPENFQINTICEKLAKNGEQVTVLTGLPNYPAGKVLKKYKFFKKRNETINDVQVIRCFEIGRRRGAFFLFLNYISFCISSIIKVLFLRKRFDCVYVYQLSPVMMALPGILYSKRKKVPLYLYCCDLWPESLKMYIGNEKNILFKAVKKLSGKIYSSCKYISVQSMSFIEYFIKEHGIKTEKLEYIPGFSDDRYLNNEYVLDNGVIDFVFLGNIGIAQNLNLVIDAFSKIKSYNYKLHIVGDGTCLSDLKKSVKDKGLEENIIFYGRKPVEEMESFYSIADICIVTLNAENKTGLTLPSKVQGYMAAGKPIVGMIDGDAYSIVNGSRCGKCVQAGDVSGFVNILEECIANIDLYKCLGENGRRYYKDNFSEDIVVGQIMKILYKTVEEYKNV